MQVNGRIVASKRFRYDKNLVNMAVVSFMIGRHGDYSADYELDAQETRYAGADVHGRPHPPYVHVLDRPMILFDFNPEIEWPDEHSSFFIEVEGDRDTRGIYTTTRDICRSLRRKLPKGALAYFFDDGKRLFLPAEVRKLC